MIAVIADDFTGAAELAGIGLRYHLSVELATEVNDATRADLLVIATDTRSMPEKEALQEMKKHTEALLALKPHTFFKKTDSVLRGHILPELLVQLPLTGCQKAVLVAANPALGRTITEGRYYIHGQPVHETSFSHDPEFPVTSSAIEQMLRCQGNPVHIKKTGDFLPDTGIVVGEATEVDDLQKWAACIDNKTLAAGASGFFNAILQKCATLSKGGTPDHFQKSEGFNPTLYVCGTTFANSRHAIQKIHKEGGPVVYMPEEMIKLEYSGVYSYVKWANEVVAHVKKYGRAIVAIHPETGKGMKVNPQLITQKITGLVNEVLQRSMVKELVIEGGATAWAVLKRSGLTRFFPVQELAPGVVRMQAGSEDLQVTVKPGSYQWPPAIWDF